MKVHQEEVITINLREQAGAPVKSSSLIQPGVTAWEGAHDLLPMYPVTGMQKKTKESLTWSIFSHQEHRAGWRR